ncbi:pantetheine-phosphate adenylyltransferase [Curvibacter sp. CHRR-16]|uniref:pantetheine-phosphate adenylyltransferase n=1 Tax=Curvibacter sp. CHRR-16 TaxID=2835872 RepID=UPI001BDAAB69|nr:pantetheine-phosphate adenylyltransferase [Curvibacter sp. CHRR-16]MBT0569597.1 pantetheine-phosphate adenylyltransferase [Curvibacter sp. CHRR-16]
MASADVVVVFPGTFDPLTLGHQDLIARSARLFGHVIVAVAAAHHKKTLFTLDERLNLARSALQTLPNVSVLPFDGLVRDFAMQHGAQAMVRGVRGVTDFDYEAQLAGMNRTMAQSAGSTLDTVFLTPDARWQHVSSTLVREIAALGGPAHDFVAPLVWQALVAKLPRKA